MQPKPIPATQPRPVGMTRRPPLSVVHAEALYRPVPPVSVDDDGYICGDNRMSESTRHERWLTYGVYAGRSLLAHLPNALVAGDLAFLFEEGNRSAVLSPDLSVALDAGRHDRGSYKLWQESGVPDFALEALSEKSWRRDVEVKPPLYEALGVREYWILDPIGKLPAPITGYRLHHGRYRRIPANRSGGWFSEVFGAELVIHDGEFRYRDIATGELIADYEQSVREREAEKRVRVDAERARIDAERARIDAERARAAAERRVAELEAELRKLRD